MKARLIDMSVRRNGEYLLSVSTKDDIRFLFDELNDVDVDIVIKKHREKRSLDANAYAWVLMNRIADKLKIPVSDVYRELIRSCHDNYDFVCVRKSAADKFRESWRNNGIGWITEDIPSKIDDCITIKVYYGSSTYDTRQMSELIDSIVTECKELGVETMTPQELDALKERWA